MECSYFTCIVELVLPPLDEYMEHPQVREKCISCQLEVTQWLEVGRKYFLCGIIMNWGKVQSNWVGLIIIGLVEVFDCLVSTGIKGT